jgi:hypothetical protein
MKRRYFLLTAVAGVAGIAGACYARSSGEAGVAKVLHKRLGYLKLDPEGVQRFASEIGELKYGGNARLHMLMRAFDAAGPLYTLPALSGHDTLEDNVQHGEDSIITLYLLSTDFFGNGADMNRTVRYVRFYNPMVACGNPFARPVTVPTPT